MNERAESSERVIYSHQIKIPVVSPQGSFAWQSPLLLAVPEKLEPGMTLAVRILSEVPVLAQLLVRGATGAGAVVSSPPASKNVTFEYPTDVGGSYDLKLSQAQRYPVADAFVRMVLKVPAAREGEEVAPDRGDDLEPKSEGQP